MSRGLATAANMMETKILLNSVISDAQQGARFLSADLKDHFLQTPINRCARRVNGNKTKKNTNNSSADYDR